MKVRKDCVYKYASVKDIAWYSKTPFTRARAMLASFSGALPLFKLRFFAASGALLIPTSGPKNG